MEVTVFGFNYEGAHFRGIACATDNRYVKLNIQGEEHQIVNFIMENFAWGAGGDDGEPVTLALLVTGMEEYGLGMFDGAGGAIKITEGDTVHVDMTEEFDLSEEGEPIDLGTVNLVLCPADDYYNSVNERLRWMLKAGKLPHREGDPEHNIFETKETALAAALPDHTPEEREQMAQAVEQALVDMGVKPDPNKPLH